MGYIQQECRDRVLSIRIQRPDKRNALTLNMYRELTSILGQAEENPEVRVVILSGCEQSFCSGNDIGDFLQAGQDMEAVQPARDFLHQIALFKKPIIAAVNGVAIGIGTTLLLHCDLVYAVHTARFQLPFINLGLVPEGGSSLLLPSMLGHQKAAELLLLGDSFDAETAASLGLVNAVVNVEELEDHARKKALVLASKPPAAMTLTKKLLKSQQGRPIAQVLDEEIDIFAQRLLSPEATEAFSAFQQRRPADFSNFE